MNPKNKNNTKINVFLLLFFTLISFSFCKKNIETGDIKYLPEDWDKINVIDKEGKTVSLTSLRGKYKIIYFGFSHCPDMCPAALSYLSKSIELLNQKYLPFHLVFISLDPERDTPEMLQKYAKMFPNHDLQAFTPTEADMKKLLDIFGIYREKKDAAKGYTIDHSNFFFVLGHTNEQIATILGNTPPEELTKQIKELIPNQ